MADRAQASYAKSLQDGYVKHINKCSQKMWKNFQDMDFENADARNEMEEIVKGMISVSDQLVERIEEYTFE